MAKTKDSRKKSVDLMDFSNRSMVTAVLDYVRTYIFPSIIHLGRYACGCTAAGIKSVAKTVKGVFMSVVKKKRVWPATNPVRIRIASGNRLISLCYFDLKRHQTLDY